MDEVADIVAVVRRALRSAADPARAAGQQAYMKSEMPFLGVRVPEARRIARAALPRRTTDAVALAVARTLWDEAEAREERYAAMAVLARADVAMASIPLIEHMVRTGRWWDITDELAHRLADLLDRFPDDADAVVRRWAVDADPWVRRIAVLSQLGRRERVDRELLAAVLEPNLADREFFIRKAVGWALREYARVDPDWVREYATTRPLRPLSRREALKHL